MPNETIIDGKMYFSYPNPRDGRPIIDPLPGFEKRTLPITSDNIKNGIPNTVDHCAGAVAACEHLDCLEALIQKGRTYLRFRSHPEIWMRYRTPGSLKFEALVGDRDGKQEPSLHYLMPLSKSATLGRQTGTDKVKGKVTPGTPRKNKPYVIENVRTSIVKK